MLSNSDKQLFVCDNKTRFDRSIDYHAVFIHKNSFKQLSQLCLNKFGHIYDNHTSTYPIYMKIETPPKKAIGKSVRLRVTHLIDYPRLQLQLAIVNLKRNFTKYRYPHIIVNSGSQSNIGNGDFVIELAYEAIRSHKFTDNIQIKKTVSSIHGIIGVKLCDELEPDEHYRLVENKPNRHAKEDDWDKIETLPTHTSKKRRYIPKSTVERVTEELGKSNDTNIEKNYTECEKDSSVVSIRLGDNCTSHTQINHSDTVTDSEEEHVFDLSINMSRGYDIDNAIPENKVKKSDENNKDHERKVTYESKEPSSDDLNDIHSKSDDQTTESSEGDQQEYTVIKLMGKHSSSMDESMGIYEPLELIKKKKRENDKEKEKIKNKVANINVGASESSSDDDTENNTKIKSDIVGIYKTARVEHKVYSGNKCGTYYYITSGGNRIYVPKAKHKNIEFYT